MLDDYHRLKDNKPLIMAQIKPGGHLDKDVDGNNQLSLRLSGNRKEIESNDFGVSIFVIGTRCFPNEP